MNAIALAATLFVGLERLEQQQDVFVRYSLIYLFQEALRQSPKNYSLSFVANESGFELQARPRLQVFPEEPGDHRLEEFLERERKTRRKLPLD